MDKQVHVQRLITLSDKVNEVKELALNCDYVTVPMFANILELQNSILDTIVNYKTIDTNKA